MESKTIEYKGKVYEIGKYYLFGYTDGEEKEFTKLDAIFNEDIYPFKADGSEFDHIKELPSPDNFGTITDKPVGLVGGE